jgi:ferredoxin
METLNLIYYSATATTQKIVKEIGQNLKFEKTTEYNLAKISAENISQISNRDLTIIGLPVYAGRLPINVIESLKTIQANQSPVVIIVVYGNRAYDDALLELRDIVKQCGFKTIAGAAFIAEHSYSSKDTPIAHGRPDKQDLVLCQDFASLINNKLASLKDTSKIIEPDIPGNFPYKERKILADDVYPDSNSNNCTNCGICVHVCPTDAISIAPTVKTNGTLCTWCCACVKSCPNEARIFNNPTINALKDKLFNICSIRKEPEFYI